ncbi:glycosyltransferase [Methylosinus sp. H3A]|nr:glycosyltransferase [Methylosinus sp. H3A]
MWLATRLGEAQPAAPAPAPAPEPPEESSPVAKPAAAADAPAASAPRPADSATAAARDAGAEDRAHESHFGVYRPSRREVGGLRAIGFRPPGLPALPQALEIGRALNPLRRRMPSLRQTMLDEEETVRRIVEEGLWLPAFVPLRARWGEVALVVDASPSLRLWRPMLDELRRLLERHGAFRDVRGWRLEFDAAGAPRLTSDSHALAKQAPRGVGELQDPTGRRVVLVASDCVGPWWRDGLMHDVLQAWASRGPVALAQLLPQRMWPRTPLGLAGLRLAADAPGLPNANLRVTASADDRDRSTPLPVMTLDPGEIGRWAAVLAGRGGATVPGVRLSRFLPPPPDEFWEPQTEPSTPPPPPDARERVRRFGVSASGPARELATYLTAVPLSLPVMRLVQQLMMPTSRHAHLAEVLLGGLMRPLSSDPDEDPDDVEYEFHDPAIRDLLREGQTAAEAMEITGRVIEALSAFVAGEQGQPRSFAAALVDDTGRGPLTLPPGGRPFARLGANALRRYGGAYAALADRLAGGWEVAPELSLTVERPRGRMRRPIRQVAWSPDGERFAVANGEDHVDLFTLAGQNERDVRGTRVAWRPDGAGFTAGGPGSRFVFHPLAAPQSTAISISGGDSITALGWSSDNRSLAVGGSFGSLDLIERENQASNSMKLKGAIHQFAWSGDWIAVVADGEGDILVLDRRELRIILRLPGGGATPHSVAWSNDGELLFSGDADGRIAIWRIDRMVSIDHPAPPAPTTPLRLLTGHGGAVTALTLDASQQLLASQSADGTARIWRMDQWRCLAVIPIGAPAKENGASVAFHPSLPLLATPEANGDVLLLSRVLLRKPTLRRAADAPHILMPMWEIPPLVVGGVWTACHNLVRRLRRMGVRVTVVVPWDRSRILPDPFGDGTPVAALGIIPPGETPTTQSPYSRTPAPWSTVSIGPVWSNYAPPSSYDVPSIYGRSRRAWSSYGGAPPAWSIYGGYAGLTWSSYGGRPANWSGDAEPSSAYGGPGSSYDETSLSASALFALIGEFQKRFQEFAAEQRADLVHAHDWVTFDAARSAATRLGIPWVAHFHSLEIDRRPDGGDPLIERIEQGAVNTATRIVTPSRVTRSRLSGRYNAVDARITVIPNAASDQPAPPTEYGDPTSGRVVFIGRLARQKGVDRFCDVADIVRRVRSKASFEVFGDGETRASLRDRPVIWRGPLGWNERGRAFAGASVVIVPSRAEPFGMVILEAIERRIPVIYPIDSGAAEALGSGLFVDANDVGHMAEEVIHLLDDADFWRGAVEAQTRALHDYETRGDENRLIELWRETIAASDREDASPSIPA